MAELGDDGREVAGSIDTTRARRRRRRPCTTPGAAGVAEAELVEDQAQLLARVAETAVVPVDDAQVTGRRAADVVGPEIAVARPQIGGWLEQLLQRDPLVAELSHLFGERGPGRGERSTQLVPPIGSDWIGEPRIDWLAADERHTVDRGDELTDRDGVEVGSAFVEIDPLVDSNLRIGNVGEDAVVDRAHDRPATERRPRSPPPGTLSASAMSASSRRLNGSLTAHVPSDVCSFHICPCSPRAVGPDSDGGRHRACSGRRWARRGRFEHRCSVDGPGCALSPAGRR